MLRFAPSPTGFLHIGNARVAVLNYLYAQKKKKNFFSELMIPIKNDQRKNLRMQF